MSSQSLQPILALLGDPVGGNPIQYMTEKAFAQLGLDWRYLSLEIRADDLADAVRGMKVMGFLGGNCAAPHKESICPLLDRLGQTAELTGTVNLIRRENDELVGENTEGKALVDLLKQKSELAGRRVVLLGAGRIAKAIVVELATAEVGQITIVDRNQLRAVELAEMIRVQFETPVCPILWEADYTITPDTDFVIHATSVSQNDPDASVALYWDSLPSSSIVVDTTIDPLDTSFLEQARQRGCATVDGAEIFTNQIFLNFQAWTGTEPDRRLLREALEEFLGL